MVAWLRHYAASRKVVGLRPDEVNDFFQFTQSFLLHCGPGVHSASNRNEYQKMILWSRVRPVHKADYLTAICKPIV
jgi:hypothetical protein